MRKFIGWLLLYKKLWSLRHSSSLLASRFPARALILGHRGARADAPENTVASFCLAMEMGADGVELDVFLSADGVPVVIHDQTLDRTTNGVGKVGDMSFANLQQLAIKTNASVYQDERIPSLDDVMMNLPDHAWLNVELKESGRYSEEEFVARILQILAPHRHRLTLIISAFNGRLLKKFRAASSDYLIALLLSPRDKYWPDSLNYIDDINPDALHIPPSMLDPLLLYLIRRAQLRVLLWTINDKKEAHRFIAMGVNGVFTDRVSLLVDKATNLHKTH